MSCVYHHDDFVVVYDYNDDNDNKTDWKAAPGGPNERRQVS